MGNANSGAGGPHRDRHKSGDSQGPSSPMGVKDGQAFSFDKRPSVGSQPVSTSSHAQPIRGSTHHAKIILQHSHDDDEPFFTQPKSAPIHKHAFVSLVISLFFFFFFSKIFFNYYDLALS